MAGHSKWANIKFRKAAQDNKRGKLFTKLIRDITVAARVSGDVDSNPRLRTAIDKALAANMTRDSINRAVKKGTGELAGDNLEEILYEGYGPCGTALLVDCLTDNKNRTVSEVRHAFSKYGGNLGTSGSVSYMFKKVGEILLKQCEQDRLFEFAIENGATDINEMEEGSLVLVEPENLESLTSLLEKEFTVLSSAITNVPDLYIDLDEHSSEKFMKLYEQLDQLDDVQNIYHNVK